MNEHDFTPAGWALQIPVQNRGDSLTPMTWAVAIPDEKEARQALGKLEPLALAPENKLVPLSARQVDEFHLQPGTPTRL